MERQYVAIDLHRNRSLILRQNQLGEELGVMRIDNDPVTLAAALAEAGPDLRARATEISSRLSPPLGPGMSSVSAITTTNGTEYRVRPYPNAVARSSRRVLDALEEALICR